MRLLDVVALTEDVPSAGLVRGQVGTVVELHKDGCFEVEFADDQGEPYAVIPLQARQLLVLHYAPASA